MEITNEVYNAITKYFSILSHTGYKAYTEVEKLLILSFVEELLCGPFVSFINEDDYKDILKALNCMYGSCMLPYPINNSTHISATIKGNKCNCYKGYLLYK